MFRPTIITRLTENTGVGPRTPGPRLFALRRTVRSEPAPFAAVAAAVRKPAACPPATQPAPPTRGNAMSQSNSIAFKRPISAASIV